MKFIIYILSIFILFSCNTPKSAIKEKDNVNIDSTLKVQNINLDTIPSDIDGDNIVDSEDRCPYEVGPYSNFGCPEVLALIKDEIIKKDDRDRNPASEGGIEIIKEEPTKSKKVIKVLDMQVGEYSHIQPCMGHIYRGATSLRLQIKC